MLTLRNITLASTIADPDLRSIIEQRFADMSGGDEYEADPDEEYPPDLLVIVVEPGDSVQAIESESGCPILRNLCGDVRFGEPGFTPCFEMLEEHAGFYELVYIPGDGDSGINIFIPKVEGMDAGLLAMCDMYSVPAPELTEP